METSSAGGSPWLSGQWVDRERVRQEWQSLAVRYKASFGVVECICSETDVHRSRVEGRHRDIPGWYELDWAHVVRGGEDYQLLRVPKVVIDAIQPIDDNLRLLRQSLLAAAKPTSGR